MNSIPELIEDIRQGRMVILVDDEDRENEGDLVLAADHVSPEKINFMVSQARGLVCLSLTSEQVDRLQLPMMIRDEMNLSPNKTAFTVSIEAAHGVSTGISTSDRATTIRVASRPDAKPSEVITPGHVFPIRAQPGGVLKRAGHTEGSVDLARLAGLNPAAVICEVMNEDGSMARLPELKAFSKKHGIKIGSIVELIRYRLQNEILVQELASANLPNQFGKDFRIRVFKSLVDGAEHVLLQKDEVDPSRPILTRVHSECMTGDVFGSLRCDCGPQLHAALAAVEKEGAGLILYLRQEGRGIGLINKIKAYALQEQGLDTVDANVHLGFRPDERDYGIGAQILRLVGARRLKLLTNNPAKRVGLKGYGIEIAERVPLQVGRSPENETYLRAKQNKMGHLLEMEEVASNRKED